MNIFYKKIEMRKPPGLQPGVKFTYYNCTWANGIFPLGYNLKT